MIPPKAFKALTGPQIKLTAPFKKRDHTGYLMVQHSCAVCDKCWLYLEGPMAGYCIYAGPYTSYKKIN